VSDVSAATVDDAVGYAFRDRALVETALSHASYAHETDGSRGNERLEFLGDAVLDLLIAELLFEAHPGWKEGELTRARAALVNRRALANRARTIGLGGFLKLGRTELLSGGEAKDRVLADCFEAMVAAIYLDGGLEPAKSFARRCFGEALARRPPQDAKTELQEWAHAQLQRTPSYAMIADSETEDDDERFTVEVSIGGKRWGVGVGRSKQRAERAAARDALERSSEADSLGDGSG
jgi:ribonuclease-3